MFTNSYGSYGKERNIQYVYLYCSLILSCKLLVMVLKEINLIGCVKIVGVSMICSEVDHYMVLYNVGVSWGEKGYIRIARGNNTCGIASIVIQVAGIEKSGANQQYMIAPMFLIFPISDNFATNHVLILM